MELGLSKNFKGTLANVNWTAVTPLASATVCYVTALVITCRSTTPGHYLSYRIGNGDDRVIPATTDGNGSFTVPIPAGVKLAFNNADGLLEVKASNAPMDYIVTYTQHNQ